MRSQNSQNSDNLFLLSLGEEGSYYYMANNSSVLLAETHSTKQVFFSYSRTDLEACITLRSALEKTGLNVFQDEDKTRIGDQWLMRLQETLQGCSAFVLLIGRDGVQRWVGAEVQVALIRHFSHSFKLIDGRLFFRAVLFWGSAPSAGKMQNYFSGGAKKRSKP